MRRFEDQVAVVTGGAGGMGAGIAQRLAREGATVVLFDTRQRDLLQCARQILTEGHKVDAFVVDVTSDSQVYSAMEEVVPQR